MLYDGNWTDVYNLRLYKEGYSDIKSITYDAANDEIYFVNNKKRSSGIYKLKIVEQEPFFNISSVVEDRKDNIRDLVIDSIDKSLFWSDSNGQKIYKMNLETKEVETFLDVPAGIEGIAIDTCTRSLFFVTDSSEKMNVVSLSDEKKVKKEISSGNHDQPIAIAIDHQTRRIYVADDQSSSHYSIDSILRDGSDFRREIDSRVKVPRSIAIDSAFVYYLDGSDHELRKFSKISDKNEEKESMVMKTFSGDPQDIIVRNNFVIDMNSELCNIVVEPPKAPLVVKTVEEPALETCSCEQPIEKVCEVDRCDNFCLNEGECSIVKNEPKCSCKSRFVGDRCETEQCTNFCFNNGECSILKNEPKCSCKSRFVGDRCETERCTNFCLNKGECNFNEITKLPQCKCENDFAGDRCEISKKIAINLQADANEETPIPVPETSKLTCNQSIINASNVIIAICITLSLTIFLIILIVLKKLQRPMRPRVRKTFKVHKNIEPMTYRPYTEHCEVIIEDCCNMNICETVSLRFKN